MVHNTALSHDVYHTKFGDTALHGMKDMLQTKYSFYSYKGTK